MSTNPYDTPPEKTPPPSFGDIPPDARQMAMLAHLLGALLGFLGPLIIWLTQKDKHPFVDDQAKEALNFHLTLLIAYVVSSVVGMVLSCVTFGISGLLPVAVWIVQLIFGIIGTTKANNGEVYRYPFNIRFIK